jgi:hypothetical protein
MSKYIATIAVYKDLTVLPSEYLDDVETRYAGWIDSQLTFWSGVIDSRLRKRYTVPFVDPVPAAVQLWLARLVDVRVQLKRGVDATDGEYQDVSKSASDAMSELKEAADSNTGLYDLPLASGESLIVRATPMSSSQADPYQWSRIQRSRSGGNNGCGC